MPVISGQCWLVVDADTGDVISGFRHTERRCIASMTKIATAAVVLQCAQSYLGLLDTVASVSFEVRVSQTKLHYMY